MTDSLASLLEVCAMFGSARLTAACAPAEVGGCSALLRIGCAGSSARSARRSSRLLPEDLVADS